jgi:hypothetical protein
MTKKGSQQDQLNQVSGGGHLGGTRFGQQPGDAKVKRDDNLDTKHEKTPPKDESSS